MMCVNLMEVHLEHLLMNQTSSSCSSIRPEHFDTPMLAQGTRGLGQDTGKERGRGRPFRIGWMGSFGATFVVPTGITCVCEPSMTHHDPQEKD